MLVNTNFLITDNSEVDSEGNEDLVCDPNLVSVVTQRELIPNTSDVQVTDNFKERL